MKYIKKFETGSWSRGIDWDYVKDNPDDDSEEANWIRKLGEEIEDLIELLDNKSILELVDIKGLDIYQGPYAKVNIFEHFYKIWTTETYKILYIEGFPIENEAYSDEEENDKGFKGNIYEIAETLNDIYHAGGNVNLYKVTKKYNL